MFKSFKLGTYFGTDFKIHPSVLLLIGFIIYPAFGEGQEEILKRVTFAAIILVCITLHEFGHSLMARRLGYETLDIILNLMGGIMTLKTRPETPKDELLITLAGPAVNLVIAAVALGAYFLVDPATGTFGHYTFVLIIGINLVLVVFNMLPIFPLDGGRVLRSLLAMPLGMRKGTLLAVGIGMILILPLFIYAIYSFDFVLIVICVFVLTVSIFEFTRALRLGAADKCKSVEDQGLGV